MQIFDTIVLLIVLIAAFYGWRKGLATQIASIASLGVSFFVARNFHGSLAEISGLDLIAAMLILFLASSVVIWLIFRQVKDAIETMKLGEFDHQMGAFFGAGKGFIIASLLTMFTMGLPFVGESVKQSVVGSRSGHWIAGFLYKAHSIMPQRVHDLVGPYLNVPFEEFRNQMGSGTYPGQPGYAGQPGYPSGTTYPQQPTYPPSTAQRPAYQPQQQPAAYPPSYNQNPNAYPRSAPNYGSQTQPYNPPAAPTYQPPGNWATPASPATQPRY